MTNTVKATPEMVAGKKTLYCQNCKDYDRRAVAKREPGCKKHNKYVARKGFCEEWEG